MNLNFKQSPVTHRIAGMVFFLSALTLLSFNQADAAKKKKTVKFPQTRITAFNYHDGISKITPGLSFTVDASIHAAADFPEAGRYQVPVALYLAHPESAGGITKANIATNTIYLGRGYIRSPKKGESVHQLEISGQEALIGHDGNYKLIAWLDPEDAKSLGSGLFFSDLTVEVSGKNYNKPALSIAHVDLDTQAILAGDTEAKTLGGSLTVQSQFANTASGFISACLVQADGACSSLEIWDPAVRGYGSGFRILNLDNNDKVTTLFQLKLPPLAPGQNSRIRFRIEDESLLAESAESEADFTVFTAPVFSSHANTDFDTDVKERIKAARRTFRQMRLRGVIPSFKLKKSKDGSIDLARSLESIANARNAVVIKAIGKTVNADSSSLPPDMVSSITGSRFNMPDQDFPWLKDIDVKADPPPQEYRGAGFPTIAEYRRCIPFFCGPNSPAEAGQAPSESCIRRFCGSTFEDIRYGGRNPNLLEVNTGYDKSYSAGGFGARVGIGGQAKVYHDKAISDYVAASYNAEAFFGVKVFSYSVPIFEATSQAVYSPTELTEGMSRNEFKILGRLIEKREAGSSGLSIRISKTYGVKKSADVGIGPFSVDIQVEAGGTGGLGLGIDQIDILRGISGNVTPFARIGATARAVTDVGFGRFGVSGELTLMEDSVPVVATFNVGLDLARKVIRPQLNLNISNILTGPNGRIDLILIVGSGIFEISYSTKLASFSTEEIPTSIYNKNTVFSELSYRR